MTADQAAVANTRRRAQHQAIVAKLAAIGMPGTNTVQEHNRRLAEHGHAQPTPYQGATNDPIIAAVTTDQARYRAPTGNRTPAELARARDSIDREDAEAHQ